MSRLLFRRAGVTVTAAAAAVALSSACADEPDDVLDPGETEPAETTETTEEQEQYFADSEYIGESVTVTAAVETDLTDESVILNAGDYGDESLLVLFKSDQPEFAVGDTVTASGTVQHFSYDEYSEEYGLGESTLYEVYADEQFLLADSVNVE